VHPCGHHDVPAVILPLSKPLVGLSVQPVKPSNVDLTHPPWGHPGCTAAKKSEVWKKMKRSAAGPLPNYCCPCVIAKTHQVPRSPPASAATF
jgi:hypothetical protein